MGLISRTICGMTKPTDAPPLPERIEWTGNDAADRLIAQNPVALLIGFCIDQQITVQHAFMGPLTIRERLGTLDPAKLAAMDPDVVEEAFREEPAIHRYPTSMARRVQEMCAVLTDEYKGDAAQVWLGAKDGQDLVRRLRGLPGIGETKAGTLVAVIGKHLGVKPPGWEAMIPNRPTLGDVTNVEERKAYQAHKRAMKLAAKREAAEKKAAR